MTKNYHEVARHIVARHTKHGIDSNNAKLLGTISSVGTERNYRQCLSNFLRWCDDNGIPPNFRANFSTLKQYLDERREWVQQKTLNQERQSLQIRGFKFEVQRLT
jgi:site-specific recombinase XerD